MASAYKNEPVSPHRKDGLTTVGLEGLPTKTLGPGVLAESMTNTGGLVCPICQLRQTSMADLVTHVAHCTPRRTLVSSSPDPGDNPPLQPPSLDVEEGELDEEEEEEENELQVMPKLRDKNDASEPESGGEDSVNRRWECTDCGKDFPQASYLTKHKVVHTEVKRFPCSVCNRRFRLRGQLVLHMTTHTNERPFGCPHCPQAFARKAYLTSHILTHTGERPFRCDLCKSGFTQRSNLRRHVRLVHSKPEGSVRGRLPIRTTPPGPSPFINGLMPPSAAQLPAPHPQLQPSSSRESAPAVMIVQPQAHSVDQFVRPAQFAPPRSPQFKQAPAPSHAAPVSVSSSPSSSSSVNSNAVAAVAAAAAAAVFAAASASDAVNDSPPIDPETAAAAANFLSLLSNSPALANLASLICHAASLQQRPPPQPSAPKPNQEDQPPTLPPPPPPPQVPSQLSPPLLSPPIMGSPNPPSPPMLGDSGPARHPCPRCERTFRQKRYLASHMLIHTGDRPYGCNVCHKRFTQRSNMNRHRRGHSAMEIEAANATSHADSVSGAVTSQNLPLDLAFVRRQEELAAAVNHERLAAAEEEMDCEEEV